MIFPPGARTRWARRVLHRWETLRLDEALPLPVGDRDPRLRAAEAIAERIQAHPLIDSDSSQAVSHLMARVRIAVHDLGSLDLLEEGSGAREELARTRSSIEEQLSCSLRDLDELYHALHRHKGPGTGSLQVEVRNVLARVAAAAEVEVLAPDLEK
jgi:hypothetical protein